MRFIAPKPPKPAPISKRFDALVKCPWCGHSFSVRRSKANEGMIVKAVCVNCKQHFHQSARDKSSK